MTGLSFRTKLFLVMMLVVCGVTGLTLLVTQQRLEATYQRMLQEQFEGQIRAFTDLQQTRLGFVADKCRSMVSLVRLQALLEEGDGELLYGAAADDLRQLGQGLASAQAASFFRFLDVSGQVIPTQDPRAGFTRGSASEALRRRLAPLGEMMSQERDQQIGFLAAETEAERLELQEVIVTKVMDQARGAVRGALVLAFPVPELLPGRPQSEAVPHDSPPPRGSNIGSTNQIKFGILADGTLFAPEDGIPSHVRAELAGRIADEIKQASAPRHDPEMMMHGMPHRLFYRALNSGSSFPPAFQICLYSLAEAQAEKRALRRGILSFGGVTLLGALGLCFVLSQGLSVPIRELVVGTNEVRRGNLTVKVPVRSRDDLGQLASSFNDMATGLAQKEKYRNILNMVADEQVAQQMVAGEVLLGGARREVSVLFCDIRGFTALTENMPPEEVIAMLNEHMTALAGVVRQHHGVIDKFVGDLIMAIFGAPLSRGHDVEAAARCALQMVAVRRSLDQTSRYRIEVGVGVATGEMVAGCMGSADRLNYTVLGPRVNLASRLCSRAQAGQVLIDQETRNRLGPEFEIQPIEPLALKGFRETVAAFALIAVRPAHT